MEKLLKQRVEILAQEVDKMKSGGAGEGYTKSEADAKFLSKDDASTALAGKQDSLNQTQLAAVNSGIDSAKVAQIENNKTNILLVEQLNGAKNLAEINDATFTRDMYIPCKLKANTDYTLTIQSFTSESSADTSQLLFYNGDTQVTDGQTVVYRTVPHGNNISKTIQIPADCDRLRIYSGSEGTSSDYKSATFTHLMFIEKSIYDAGLTQYMPFALSNSILTPALIEQIDKGAKNIFDITTPNLLRDTVLTPLSNGGATLSCNNAAWTQYGKNVDVEVGKKYKVIVYIDSITGSVGTDFNVNLSQDSTFLPITPTNTGEYSVEVESTATTLGVAIFINNSGTPKSLSINMRMMICTIDEWKVSQQYIPYALPNYDLTQLEAEDRDALAEKIDSGAKNVLSWSLEEAKRINTDGTWSGNVYTHNGIAYTVNSDMTVNLSMVSGTATHPHSVFKLSESVSNSYTDSYVLSSGNTYMSDSSFALYAEETDSPWTDIAIDYGTGTIISSTAQSAYSVYISVKADYVLSTTQTVKPMICTEADWNVSQAYQPYRPSYQELYEMVLAIQTTRTATTRKTTKTKTNEE